MAHSNFAGLFRRDLADKVALNSPHTAEKRHRGSSRLAGIWSAATRPFYKSIYIRFQYAFGFAVFGLLIIAAITIVSGRVVLNTYEDSVSEAHFEMMPAHSIEVALREAEHLSYLFAVEGDRSAPSQFKVLSEMVDRQFRQLDDNNQRFGSLEHAHSNVSIPNTIKAWLAARADVLEVFRQKPGTAQAAKALARAHEAIDPVYGTISKFHHGSMLDMQMRLRSAVSVAKWTFVTIFGAIMIGLAVLVTLGAVVGRSVLQPISKLQVAAQSLSKKDFSHRVRLRNNKDELGQLGRALNVASIVLQRLYRELERRSTYDGLTGVLNRTAFDARLAEECKSTDRHERPLSLLMVDIDFFKQVNDNYGHQTGDHVLQTLVRLLHDSIRPGDIVARYGGEEFVIIFPETNAGGAAVMAERVRKAIEGHIFTGGAGESFNLTISIGCASWLAGAMTPDELVKASDVALYLAKKAGRNRVVSSDGTVPVDGVGWGTAA